MNTSQRESQGLNSAYTEGPQEQMDLQVVGQQVATMVNGVDWPRFWRAFFSAAVLAGIGIVAYFVLNVVWAILHPLLFPAFVVGFGFLTRFCYKKNWRILG